jgi:hypothetical protein
MRTPRTAALLALTAFVVIWGGCTSVGSLGLVTRTGSDPASILREGRKFRELGFVEGSACRSFLLNVIPWGNGDVQAAVDDALSHSSGGDAMLNVTTSNTLLGFIPLYNIFASDCTRVRGTAVQFLPR